MSKHRDVAPQLVSWSFALTHAVSTGTRTVHNTEYHELKQDKEGDCRHGDEGHNPETPVDGQKGIILMRE
jgi:hypothetical protein